MTYPPSSLGLTCYRKVGTRLFRCRNRVFTQRRTFPPKQSGTLCHCSRLGICRRMAIGDLLITQSQADKGVKLFVALTWGCIRSALVIVSLPLLPTAAQSFNDWNIAVCRSRGCFLHIFLEKDSVQGALKLTVDHQDGVICRRQGA